MTVENRVARTSQTANVAEKTAEEAPLDFEHSLAELEALVAHLEHGDLPLDDALKSFERGVALTRQCQGLLKTAQQKVEVLLSASTAAEPEPFIEPPEGSLNSAD